MPGAQSRHLKFGKYVTANLLDKKMLWGWKSYNNLLIKIMINVSAGNAVTDTERFTKKIVPFFPLLARFLCESTYAGDTREGEERSNLVGDR